MKYLSGLFFHIGAYFNMMFSLFAKPENFKFYWQEFIHQLYELGVKALPIIFLVSVFSGAVTALQLASQLKLISYIPYTLVGDATKTGLFLSISPTFTATVLAGVVGSKITAEIGNMRISEQIDALEIMGINSKLFLIAPKILSMVILTFFLTVLSYFLSYLGARVGVMVGSDLTGIQFDEGFFMNAKLDYARMGIIKSTVFAYIITSVAAYFGYHVKGGAVQIGQATTTAVIVACILILLGDFVLTTLLL